MLVPLLLYSQYRDQLPKSIIHVVSCMLPTSYYPYSSLNTVRTTIKPFINECNFVLIGLNHFDLTILYHYLVCVFVVDSFHNTNTYVMYKLTRFTIPSFTNSCVLACWIKKRDIAFFQVHLIHQLSDFPTHHILIFRLALFISICRYGISMLWFIN